MVLRRDSQPEQATLNQPTVPPLPRVIAPEPLKNTLLVEAPPEWSAQTVDGTVATQSILSVARNVGPRSDGRRSFDQPIRTGFEVLDQWIGNGLRAGELLLLGGAPGVGKTTLCLQIARNIAASGRANVLYACYEHSAEYILDRLLVQETIDPSSATNPTGISLDALHGLIGEAHRRNPNGAPYETLRTHPVCGKAISALDRYSGRFHLVANAPRKNGIDVLHALIGEHRTRDNQPLVLFVDYLQKIEAERNDLPNEEDRVTEVVQALKQIALEHNIAVVAIAAAEKAGIKSPRLRLSHFRGSSALMYEADIAIIMNDKWQIIDRDHIVFNQHKAQQFRDWVVCTIEKNRSGRNLIEIELMKRFEYCCFNPHGGKVTERLYEERIQGEG